MTLPVRRLLTVTLPDGAFTFPNIWLPPLSVTPPLETLSVNHNGLFGLPMLPLILVPFRSVKVTGPTI